MGTTNQSNSKERPSKSGLLPQTDWSQIRRLRSASPAEEQPLLDVLAEKYWTPIFHYLLCQGHDQFEAQDLIQDFFVFALRTRLFAKADEQRGRFRSFLLGSLNNFVANERRKQSAQKRKPEQGVGSLDELIDDGYFHPKSLVNSETPEVLFHRAWVREVVRNVLQDLEKDFKGTGKTTHFILFQSRVVSPEMDGDEPPPLQQQASELGLGYKEAANQILTAKRAFLRILDKEIRSYVRSGEDAEQERLDIERLLRMEAFR